VLARLLAGLGTIALATGLVLRQEERAKQRRRAAIDAAAGNPWASRVQLSIDLLRRTHPEFVADTTLTVRQTQVLLCLAGIVAFCLDVSVHLTVMVLVAVAICLYLVSLAVRLHIFRLGLNERGMIRIDDATARDFPAESLPTYTILVPAYNEPQVFGQLVENLRALDYPRDKLELMLLLEADDEETIAAARAAVGDLTDFVIVRIPPAEPRTKPKATSSRSMTRKTDRTCSSCAKRRSH
jgi:glycosyltransferase XagB